MDANDESRTTDCPASLLPNWNDQTVLVVAGGASAPGAVERAKGRYNRSIAVNLAFRLLPDADVLYAGDSGFWAHYVDSRRFKGLKISPRYSTPFLDVLSIIELQQCFGLVFDPIGTVGTGGGNSGFQALNLAVQLGAGRILLAGFDFAGRHWHDDHAPSLHNPTVEQFERWRRHFDAALFQIRQLGIQVFSL